MTTLAVTLDDRGVARVRLDRPAKHNAFDAALIAALTAAFTTLSADTAVRAVVLSGNGPSFCAGADAAWMRASGTLSDVENRADALLLSDMLAAIDTCARPVIAVAHGNIFGPVAGVDGRVAVQIRDLDQTVIGNPAHDIIRLALSLATASRGSDLPGVTTARTLEHLMTGYETALAGDFDTEGERTLRLRH